MRGATITWGDLAPALAEVNGAAALEDAVLDRLIARRLQESAITLTPRDLQHEREQIARALADEAGLDADATEETLTRIRRERGLGPRRFEALLRRNAGLRALARPEAAPTQQRIDQEIRLLSSERVRARIIVSASRPALESARAEILSNTSDPELVSARFAERARRLSNDASAPAGGLLEALSPEDPAVPQGIRDALRSLRAGSMSEVVTVPSGYALLLVEDRFSPGVLPDRQAIEARLRLRAERVIMQRLARELLADAGVSVVDESLAWSWDAR